MDSNSSYAMIGAGVCNCIITTAGTTYSCYSFIGAGKLNTIASSCNSSIVGGQNNTISGMYSSILGGSGNAVPSTVQYAGVFGCNVTAVQSCAMHANNFVAQNMPLAPGSGIPGSLYYDPGTCIVHITI